MNTDKLKALALAATPGEWKVERLQGGGHHNVGIRVRGPIVSGFAAALNTRWANEAQTAEQEANAAYIAAACPATVLELIAERDELRAEVERLKNERDLFRLGHSNASNRCCELEAEVERLQAARDQALEEAATVADAERAEYMSKAGDNNGRESDFAFGSVNSAERIAAAIRSISGVRTTNPRLAPTRSMVRLARRAMGDSRNGGRPMIVSPAPDTTIRVKSDCSSSLPGLARCSQAMRMPAMITDTTAMAPTYHHREFCKKPTADAEPPGA